MQGAIYCGVPAANTAFKITDGPAARGPRAGAAIALGGAGARRRASHLQRAAAGGHRCRARAPPVVLSHALGLDLRMWDELWPRARAETYTVLRYDHRGHGGSAVRRGPVHDGRARRRRGAADPRVEPRPVIWIGLSMGGMVGQGLAIRHPELLRGAGLANTRRALSGAARRDLGGAHRRGRAGRHGGGRRRGGRALPRRRLSAPRIRPMRRR